MNDLRLDEEFLSVAADGIIIQRDLEDVGFLESRRDLEYNHTKTCLDLLDIVSKRL